MFTDTHCHIFKEYYSDLKKVLDNSLNNHVNRVICAGTCLKDCREIIENAKLYDNYYICLGIHPEEVDDSVDELENLIKENINNKMLVAIGEIGLDYYYGKDTKNKQIELFESQLRLAEKYNLPVVVHSREATLDTINSIRKYKVKGVIHCFGGSIETAKEYLKLGFYFGVGGVMTFKKANIKDVIKEIPMDRIVLETDSPYLAPEPFRGTTNEPKNVLVIAEFLANLKGISIEDVSKITEDNVKNIFNI